MIRLSHEDGLGLADSRNLEEEIEGSGNSHSKEGENIPEAPMEIDLIVDEMTLYFLFRCEYNFTFSSFPFDCQAFHSSERSSYKLACHLITIDADDSEKC